MSTLSHGIEVGVMAIEQAFSQLLSQRFLQLVTKSSRAFFVIALFAVIFNYWGVFRLEQIPVPNIVDYMYGYLLLNGVAASYSIYSERKLKVTPGKFCPRCDRPLEVNHIVYECPKCGVIKFEKE